MSKAHRVRQELGRLAFERGRAHEVLVLEIVNELRADHQWIRSARLATPEEDRRGIDVVVTTDVGDLYLQVKSSPLGAARFHAGSRTTLIGCVVVAPKRTRARVLAVLSQLLAEVQRRRGQ